MKWLLVTVALLLGFAGGFLLAPEAGFIWAATVADGEKRKDTLSRSVREWAKTDPDAALRAVKNAEIGAEEKEPLLRML